MGRNLSVVADKIINIINKNYMGEDKEHIINNIEHVKAGSQYRAPELAYMDWNDLANILNKSFIPENSKWETEIMIVFNDLNGNIEDYYQGD